MWSKSWIEEESNLQVRYEQGEIQSNVMYQSSSRIVEFSRVRIIFGPYFDENWSSDGRQMKFKNVQSIIFEAGKMFLTSESSKLHAILKWMELFLDFMPGILCGNLLVASLSLVTKFSLYQTNESKFQCKSSVNVVEIFSLQVNAESVKKLHIGPMYHSFWKRSVKFSFVYFQTGDRILEVDGVDLRHASHERAVEVIRASSRTVTFLVQSLVQWVSLLLSSTQSKNILLLLRGENLCQWLFKKNLNTAAWDRQFNSKAHG